MLLHAKQEMHQLALKSNHSALISEKRVPLCQAIRQTYNILSSQLDLYTTGMQRRRCIS